MTDRNTTDVRLLDLGPRGPMKAPVKLVIAKGNVHVSYTMTEDTLRVAVAQLIELATNCGAAGFESIDQDKTGEVRATDGLAFLARTLRCISDAELEITVIEEIERFGGAELGAREVYANLMVLEEWLGLFYGKLSRRFLCQHHQHLADAQEKIAETYALENVEHADDVTLEHVETTALMARIFGALRADLVRRPGQPES